MKMLEGLLLTLAVTSAVLEFEAHTRSNTGTIGTTIATGQNSTKAAPAKALVNGYLGLSITNNFVSKVFEGSPAQKAGISAGDKIMEINNNSVYGVTVDGIADQLIGPVGTNVDVIVEHVDSLSKLSLIRSKAVPEEAYLIAAKAAIQHAAESNEPSPAGVSGAKTK